MSGFKKAQPKSAHYIGRVVVERTSINQQIVAVDDRRSAPPPASTSPMQCRSEFVTVSLAMESRISSATANHIVGVVGVGSGQATGVEVSIANGSNFFDARIFADDVVEMPETVVDSLHQIGQ